MPHRRFVSLPMMARMAAVPMAAPSAWGAEVKERAAAGRGTSSAQTVNS